MTRVPGVSFEVAAARLDLPGATSVAVAPLPPGGHRGVEALEAARLVGLARRLLATGAVDVPHDVVADLVAAHHRVAIRDLTLERTLLQSLDVWGVDPALVRVLKGPAIAHLDEADPACRSFIDVDLLVPSDHLGSVVAAALAHGAERSFPELRPGFDRRFSKGVNLVLPSGFALDLHRSLAQGPFGLAIDPEELAAAWEPFTVGGTPLRALDRAGRWVHACQHAVLGGVVPPLVSLRDVVLTMPRTEAELADALGRAARWRCEAVLAEAVRLAARRLLLDPAAAPEWGPVATWVGSERPTRRERRWLAAYRGARSTPLLTLYGAEAVRGVRARAAYARAILHPLEVGADPSRLRRLCRAVGSLPRHR